MNHNQLLIMIIIISSCFFIGSILLEHGSILWTMFGRGSLGLVVIALMNEILAGFGWAVPVGINVLNFTITAFLGVPGLLALYGIGFWQIFG